MPDLDSRPRYQPARGAISNNRGKVILLCKLSQHLSSSCGVLVHENHDAAMKGAFSEAFGDQRNGPLFGEFEGQGQQLEFESGNVSETRQSFLVIPMFGHGPVEAEPDRHLAGGEIAHDAEPADSTARISP
jgi:hypothetical protein